jgi:hypothetical protein
MNWQAVLKPYRHDGSLARIQRANATQPLPQHLNFVERGAILRVGKPLDEPDTIATGNVVRTQARQPLGCGVGLGSTWLYDGVRHDHFARALVNSTPYVV